MYYAGIGSRKTPDHILRLMTRIAARLSELGYILRSGGAYGADRAFEVGAGQKEIFIAEDADSRALELASQYHPAWDKLSEYARKLHARNCYQILGRDLSSPVVFVVCWTLDGAETITSPQSGGTGQAIRIAAAHQIPVFNLKNEDALDRLGVLIKSQQ